MKRRIDNIAYLLSWIASFLAMTLAERYRYKERAAMTLAVGKSGYHKERVSVCCKECL
jgi:hypothetical protein